MEPERSPKITRWFLSLPVAPDDPDHGALRVTRYVEEVVISTRDGSVRVPSHHVRFSIWIDDHAVCAISIPDDGAEELAAVLTASVRHGDGEPERVAD